MAKYKDFVVLKQAVQTEHCGLGTYKPEIQYIQCVPLATEPGISLIILNLNRSTFVV